MGVANRYLGICVRTVILSVVTCAAAIDSQAQVWQLDTSPIASPAIILNEALSDIASDGQCPANYGDWGLPNVRDLVPAGPFGNVCPPSPFNEEAIGEGILVSGFTSNVNLLPCFTGGAPSIYAYGADADLFTTDAAVCGFPQCHITCTPVGLIGIKGSGTRTLQIDWRSASIITSLNDEHFGRCFDSLLTKITARIVRVAPGTQMTVGYSWKVFLQAIPVHEGPNMEDPVQSESNLAFDIDGTGPTITRVAHSGLANGDIGPGTVFDSGMGVIAVSNFGTPTLTLDLGAFSRAEQAMEPTAMPPDLTGNTESIACGTIKLTIHAKTFVTPSGEPMSSYMRCIPPGGGGTGYTFGTGRHEITNAQFSDFLNLTELDGGATEVSEFLVIDAATGNVSTTGGITVIVTQNSEPSSHILYDPSALLGVRYSVEPSYENHPVVNLTQNGAMKFCNWLTLDQGYGIGERCYTEGPDLYDWHPATISAGDWQFRDPNDAERQDLVDNYLGFRLPMDNLGNLGVGPFGAQENQYNEWYQAAAYDPAAPDVDRPGPNGETVSADHWFWGFGRDVLSSSGLQDGNWSGSGDPFDNDDAPVGFYDGTTYNPGGGGTIGNGNEAVTVNTSNPYALYDMSGNVLEYAQDKIAPAAIDGPVLRSGSWSSSAASTSATYRIKVPFGSYGSDVGFRVVRCDTSSTAWPPQAACPPQSGSPTTLMFRIVGGSSGIGWSWCIQGTGFSVCDLLVPGVPSGGTATDLAAQWVSSLNGSGCPGVSATQSGDIFSLTVPATFSLCVGPYGGSTTCCLPPMASCPFNPVIQLLSGSCACGCFADPAPPVCDGVQTVLDVVEVINVAFRGAAPIVDPNANCPYDRTNVNCDAVTSVLDVVSMIDVAFRSADPATEFCDPCP